MAKERKDYTVRANIHTMEIKTTQKINVSKILEDIAKSGNGELAARINKCVTINTTKINPKAPKYGQTYILNLNKWYKDGSEIYLYSEFTEILKQITTALGIEGCYNVSRVDLKFDSSDPNYYEENKKLIRLVINQMSDSLNKPNVWISTDSHTLEQRSLQWRTNSEQLEYYNKRLESNGESPTAARLELRLVNRIKFNKDANRSEGIRDIRAAFEAELYKLMWAVVDPETGKPDVAMTYTRSNEKLLDYMKKENYTSAIEFLRQREFRELIFTRPQLKQFLRMTYSEDGAKVDEWIRNHVDRKGSKLSKRDFCDARDIPKFFNCLMTASEKFFQN